MALAGLLVGTFFADAAAFIAIERMTPDHGRGLALAVLALAYLLSIATCIALWVHGRGVGDDGKARDEPPEPPWWPEFERAFRDYAHRPSRPPRSRGPKLPAGRA